MIYVAFLTTLQETEPYRKHRARKSLLFRNMLNDIAKVALFCYHTATFAFPRNSTECHTMRLTHLLTVG